MIEKALLHHLAYVAHPVALAIGVLAILWLGRRGARGPGAAFVFAGVVAMAIASFAASDPRVPFHDFRIAYFPAGQTVLASPGALAELTQRGVSGFVNLPLVAYAFAPFGAMPEPWAVAAFTITGLVLILAAWRRLAALGGLDTTQGWVLALLMAANGPLQNSLREGNTSHMVLFALAVALMWLRSGKSASAGALLAAVAVLKPPLVLFGLFFALRRDLRGLAAFAGVGAGAALASLSVFGWAQNLQWFQDCVLKFSGQWLSAFNVQSIPAFIARASGLGGGLMDWTPFQPPEAERIAAQALTLLLFVAAAAAWLWPRRGGDDTPERRLDLQFSMILCLAVLSSPLAWSHYYVWLLLPAALFLGHPGSPATTRLGWLALFLLTPLVWPLRLLAPFEESYRLLFVSHFLFGGLLMFGLTAWRLAVPHGVADRPPGREAAPALPAAK